MGPPQPSYLWVHPYYEHRGDAVIFIDGHWSPPGVVFVPPPPSFRVVLATPAFGVVVGPRPIGPEGCFVPAPPGSRRGIIVPAPIGTAPAVVTSAPPVVAVGMRVTTNVTNINNTRITNVTNVTNVTIVAPAAATASGRAFNGSVPAAPHLAAARPALVQARAPAPTSLHPVAPYTPPVTAGSNAARNMPHQPSVAAEAAARGSVTNPGRPTSGYTPVAQTQNPVAPHTPAPGKPATGAGGSAYAPANGAKPAVAAHPNNVNGNGAKPPKADGSKGHDPKKAEHGEEGQH
jgi:hypothetical protein